jgi:hypothetical protein
MIEWSEFKRRNRNISGPTYAFDNSFQEPTVFQRIFSCVSNLIFPRVTPNRDIKLKGRKRRVRLGNRGGLKGIFRLSKIRKQRYDNHFY